MPWEYVGDCGRGEMPRDKDWILEELKWGIIYLRFTVGEPEGYKLGIMWQEHDLGEYPSIGVSWEDPRPVPHEYLWKWELTLSEFDDLVDWSRLHPDRIDEKIKFEASVAGRGRQRRR